MTRKHEYARAIAKLLNCTTLTEEELSVLNCYMNHINYSTPSCCGGESGDCNGKDVLTIVKNKLISKPVETTNEQLDFKEKSVLKHIFQKWRLLSNRGVLTTEEENVLLNKLS